MTTLPKQARRVWIRLRWAVGMDRFEQPSLGCEAVGLEHIWGIDFSQYPHETWQECQRDGCHTSRSIYWVNGPKETA